MSSTYTLHIPNNPGLARRLAYGEAVRQLHKRNRNTNLSIIGTTIPTRNMSRSPLYRHLIENTTLVYEELIELEDIKVGLKIVDVNKNSRVYATSNKLVLHINLCIICQEFFKNNDTSEIIREMICGHPYHLNCIDRWFENHTCCPICKTNFSN